MKEYWFYGSVLVMAVLVVAACAPVQKAPERRGAEGRILNQDLSCVGHCTGYAESGDDWCFCDAPCPENGNCCSDFETACPELAS